MLLCNSSSSVVFYLAFIACNLVNLNVNRREVHLDAMNIRQSLIVGYLLRDRLN